MRIIEAADCPLIEVDFLGDDRGGGLTDDAGRGLDRDGTRAIHVQLERGTRRGEARDTQRLAFGPELHHGLAADTLNLNRTHRLVVGERLCRQRAAGLPVDWRQRADTFAPVEVGEIHIHHDDAGEEPDEHQEPNRDTQITMGDDGCAPDEARHCSPPKRKRPGSTPAALLTTLRRTSRCSALGKSAAGQACPPDRQDRHCPGSRA